MKLALVTGVSRGLGQAFATCFLEQNWQVIGIGRSANIRHPDFNFMYCDLSSAEEVAALSWNFEGVDELMLINNAGILGPVQPLQSLNDDLQAGALYQINVLTPIALCRKVLAVSKNIPVTICNISSGAGRRAISSWSLYGSSKAALDHFSVILQQEEREAGRQTRVYAVAPGVIDTDMQQQIRSSKPELFASHAQFVALKESGTLQSAKETAQNIIQKLISGEFNEVLCR